MFLGNLLGRYLSTRSGRTVSRKLYFMITIPIMVVFVIIVFAMGRSLSTVGQYTLFAVYIFGGQLVINHKWYIRNHPAPRAGFFIARASCASALAFPGFRWSVPGSQCGREPVCPEGVLPFAEVGDRGMIQVWNKC
jgi:hypothetical protein